MMNEAWNMSQMVERHPDVAAAFGSLAEQYDALFGRNAIIERLRRRIYSTIEGLIQPPSNILDINCGTGTDALALSELGYSVVGVDLSAQMIAKAAAKSGNWSNVSFAVSSYDDLHALEENHFDLVLSNFGGLNCTPDLRSVSGHIAARLKPNGYFVAVIMPPFSLWETTAFAVRGEFKEAFRRMRPHGTEARLNDIPFKVHYFSPRSSEKAFAEHFQAQSLYGMNVVSPPPHAWKLDARFPVLTSALEAIDDVLCRLPLVPYVGDHYVLVLRKRTR
jgi:ubiquinone/menaquinone biosynthesis C-methylase UbiE